MNENCDFKTDIRSKLRDEIQSLALHVDIMKNKQSAMDEEHVRNCQIEITKISDLEIELVETEQKLSDLLHQDSHSSDVTSNGVNKNSIIGLKVENDRLQTEILKTKQEIDMQMKKNSKLDDKIFELTKTNNECHIAMDSLIDIGINTMDTL